MNPKRLAFETLFDRGRVRVVVDLTVDGVLLPERACKLSPNGKHLPLDYAKSFRLPRFTVDDTGIMAELTFGGKGEYTFVPWAAVVALAVNGSVMEAWDPAFAPEFAPEAAPQPEPLPVRVRVDARVYSAPPLGGRRSAIIDPSEYRFNLELAPQEIKWLAPVASD